MGSLLTIVDAARRAAADAPSVEQGARAVERALDAFLRHQPVAVHRAAAGLAGLLPPAASCITLSTSEVVWRALLAARRRGRLARVVVAESRPGNEGVGLARRLAARRIPVTLVVDALVPAILTDVDAAVVGADAVTARGVWNKCGTLALALGARAAHRPLYVVTTEDRLVPARLAPALRVPDAQPTRVRGVPVVQRLFDVTPLSHIARVVTDAATMSPARVRARLGRGRR